MKIGLFVLFLAAVIFHATFALKCYDANYRELHCPIREGYTFGCLAATISRGDDSRGVLNCYPGNCDDYRQSVEQVGLYLNSCRMCNEDLCNADETDVERWNQENQRRRDY